MPDFQVSKHEAAAALAQAPAHIGSSEKHAAIFAVSLLCGIGFAMSLFEGMLAVANDAVQEAVETGNVGGTVMAGLLGCAILRVAPRESPPSPQRSTTARPS
jgi:Na+/H+ antiporter NhaA